MSIESQYPYDAKNHTIFATVTVNKIPKNFNRFVSSGVKDGSDEPTPCLSTVLIS